MVEDLAVMVTNGGYGVDVREKGMFKGSLGKSSTKAASASAHRSSAGITLRFFLRALRTGFLGRRAAGRCGGALYIEAKPPFIIMDQRITFKL